MGGGNYVVDTNNRIYKYIRSSIKDTSADHSPTIIYYHYNQVGCTYLPNNVYEQYLKTQPQQGASKIDPTTDNSSHLSFKDYYA